VPKTDLILVGMTHEEYLRWHDDEPRTVFIDSKKVNWYALLTEARMYLRDTVLPMTEPVDVPYLDALIQRLTAAVDA